jgi:hypothetical protein
MHQFAGSIALLTNPESEIGKLELTLRGMIETRGALKQVSEPLLNEEGVRSIIGQVQAIINRSIILSKFDDKEVSKLVLYLADSIIKDLMVNRVFYNIVNTSARDRIVFESLSTSYACLKRGHEQGERLFWKGSQQEITTRMTGERGKAGLFGKLLGWGSKNG